jgi:hypothetical protein
MALGILDMPLECICLRSVCLREGELTIMKVVMRFLVLRKSVILLRSLCGGLWRKSQLLAETMGDVMGHGFLLLSRFACEDVGKTCTGLYKHIML